MATEEVKRKLSAIFSADVEGYSRLMGEDELGTIETLTLHKETMRKLIRQYRGRVVDSTGDNLLAEFASVVDAVQCAVEVQQVLGKKNETLSENRRMHFRIGINLGDVIEEGERLFGDGVNIAARVESLAKGGGISISGTAYDQLGQKLPLGYEYIGEQSVKNIKKPVRVYRVLTEAEAAGKVIGEKRPIYISWRWTALAAILILLVAVVFGVWKFHLKPDVEPVSKEKMAFPLPDKPSIAVLPFDNMTSDPKQEYFIDGLTDQIISTISKLGNLFVIARNSTFTYKGKPVKVQKVAEDLGVRYVLEGSVQKTTDRVRVIVQLIDAIAGHNVWSERYDREKKDIFAIQDDITMEITKALRIELIEGEQARIWGKHETSDLTAYEKRLQGRSYVLKGTKEGNAKARHFFKDAIALDPSYAAAYAGLGYTHFFDARFLWSESRAKSMKMAIKYSRKAIELDDTLDTAHTLLGTIYLVTGQHEKAIAEGKRALSLNPNSAHNHAYMAGAVGCFGKWKKSIEFGKKSIRLNPFPPVFYYHWLGRAYFMRGQHDEAIVTWKKALQLNPNYLSAHAFLAACYSSLGKKAEATAAAQKVLKINPKFCLESYAKTLPYKDKADIERYIGALRKAGLPKTPPLPLPDKPSIAVLPFVNMSGDPKQEYFSDGITEEIITALSKVPGLFIIARNSSFTYKGKSVWIPTVGKELGVKYVLEGSVRRSEDKVRITAQLIQAKTNHHLWAERYDRDLKDIFAIQDEITMKIITELRVKLTDGEQARVSAKGTNNLQAYLKYLKGREQMNQFSKEGSALALKAFEEAIALDPNYAFAYEALAWVHLRDVIRKWTSTPKESFAKSVELAKKAVSLDESRATGLMSILYGHLKQHEKRIALAEKGVALNPNSALAYHHLGLALNYAAGKREEAIAAHKKAIRLDPVPQLRYLMWLAVACRDAGRYDEAIPICKKILQKEPDYIYAHTCLASCYALMGRDEEARAEAAEVLRIDPKFSVDYLCERLPYKYDVDRNRVRDSFLKAGLPH
jgi:adenylate cyclase